MPLTNLLAVTYELLPHLYLPMGMPLEDHSFAETIEIKIRLKLSRKTTRNPVNAEIETKTKVLKSYEGLDETSCFALSLFGNTSLVAQFNWT